MGAVHRHAPSQSHLSLHLFPFSWPSFTSFCGWRERARKTWRAGEPTVDKPKRKRREGEEEGGQEKKLRTESEAAVGGVILYKFVHLFGGVRAEGHGRDWIRVDEAHDLGGGRGREGGIST